MKSAALMLALATAAPATAQVVVTIASNEADASQRAIATVVVTAVRGRWHMLSPPRLPTAKAELCASGDTACLRALAAEAKATHLLVVGIAPLGTRGHVVAVQLFDVKVEAPLFEESAVQPAAQWELEEATALTNRLVETRGPPAITALADDLTYAVTQLDGNGVDASLLPKLNAALVRAVDDLRLKSTDAETACDSEPKCLQSVGEKLGVERVLAGTVGLAGDELHIALKVIDVARGEESRSIDENAPLDQAELRVRAAATKLLAPEQYHKSGSVIVTVPLTGAEIVVDGSVRGTTPLPGPIDGLPLGRRKMELRHEGGTPWRGSVELRFGELKRLDLELVDGALKEVPRDRVESGPNALLLSGVGTLGAGVVVGAGAIIAGVATYNLYQTIYTGIDTSPEKTQEYDVAFATTGTLAVISTVAIVVGGGLIGFSLME